MQGVSSLEEDPSGNFTKGGWAMPFWEGVMAQVQEEAMAEPYDMLFGRKTYQMFDANRPKGEDCNPVADMMNKATKYVITSHLSNSDWENTTILSGNAVAEIKQLKAQEGPLIQIHGSWELIQTLLAHDLIDEFRLWTFPIILGSGKRLFAQGDIPKNLDLQKSQNSENGVVMSFYQRPTVSKI